MNMENKDGMTPLHLAAEVRGGGRVGEWERVRVGEREGGRERGESEGGGE